MPATSASLAGEDAEALIEQVRLRPPLWQRQHRLHSNREHVAEAWHQIAQHLDKDETQLRKKWKYLRDQYSVELGKLQKTKMTIDGEAATCKWHYFQHLDFLSEVVRPRPAGDTPASATLVAVSADAISFNHADNVSFESSQDADSSSNQGRLQDEEELLEKPIASFDDISKLLESTYSSSSTISCDAELRTLRNGRQSGRKENSRKREREGDEDLMFFKSLMSHVKKIPDSSKLSFRSRIQELVETFAYPNTNQ